ncbi:hypothetical protein A6R68_21525 [Neotoma lepida]|uniref:Uncharacterized protein n=1 Tax=Neotoma lepida TaxID=56216 RepID=A0A1A6HPV5_NEOLE|nr:hypothetical protein A6R68_21525 [Neotoma lepida]
MPTQGSKHMASAMWEERAESVLQTMGNCRVALLCIITLLQKLGKGPLAKSEDSAHSSIPHSVDVRPQSHIVVAGPEVIRCRK